MIHQRIDPFTIQHICEILRPDLLAAKSTKDLKARLKAKGYGLRSSDQGTVLTSEPQGVALFPFSTQLS